MHLPKKGQKCYLSFYMPVMEANEKVKESLTQRFNSLGMKDVSFKLEKMEDRMYLTFADFDPTKEDRYSVPLGDLGFSDDGYENYCRALSLMVGTNVDHQFDYETSGIIIELHEESQKIMSDIESIFEDIDNLTAEEAKGRLGLLYKNLKNSYGW